MLHALRLPRLLRPAHGRSLTSRIRRLYKGYDHLLQNHRLPVSTVTGAVLSFAGDAFTQSATAADGLDGYDLNRGVSFALFGGVVTGPVNYVWLSQLDTLVTSMAPAGGWRAIMWKVGVQTFFFQPCVYVPIFFGFSAAFRGWSAEATAERVRSEYARTIVSIWGFWTPICVFTFAVLPVRQQAIFFSAVSLAWNAILSFISNQTTQSSTGDLEQRSDHTNAARLPPARAETPAARLRWTPSGRYLPDHQPPMGILDSDPHGSPPRGPTDQSIIGFLLGPGLM